MTTKAPDILTAALGHMHDRAATYDKPEGERSMPATVAAFNALTGHNLTAEQGWAFMVLLKLCRTQQGGHRPDNYEDGAAYFALMGEQAACDRAQPDAVKLPLARNVPVGELIEALRTYSPGEQPNDQVEVLPGLDPDQLANSRKSATHRDAGGNLYKVCGMSGRWLRYGTRCWHFASSDPKAVPDGLRPL